jgi:hypothetical protein
LELMESSPDQLIFSEFPEYPPDVLPPLNQDSGGTLFLPEDDPIQQSGGTLFLPESDPIQQPPMAPLDSDVVYTRSVSKRLLHLVLERRGAEYHKPVGLYRPGH